MSTGAVLTPREYLRELVSLQDFKILDCLARNESGWNNIPNYLYDGEDGRFTAWGPFQILKSTALRYSTEDRRDEFENVRIAIDIYKNEGTQPWLVEYLCK